MHKLTVTILALLLGATSFAGIALAGDDAHGCVNPAGHARGWCKTISGTAIAINGDLAQLREDDGVPATIDQRNLLRNGAGLQVGAHYVLQGYFSNDMFVAQSYGASYGNGFPNPGATASVQGIITSVSANHVTMMQGLFSTITVDDQQALNNGTAQNLFIGRNVTAWGYWSGGAFYATSIG